MSDEVNQAVTSDDQELAKVLAGVNQQVDESPVSATSPVVAAGDVPTADVAATPLGTPDPVVEPMATPQPVVSSEDDLNGIKLEALTELRPLVDKLNVSNEEKFDTYLLLLRSTDDKDLISPAHEAAKSIEDETRRAQALLDIIKEIDFLSQNKAA